MRRLRLGPIITLLALIATPLALSFAPASAADGDAFDSCDVSWEWTDPNRQADSKDITVTVSGDAPEYAVALTTFDPNFLPFQYFGRFDAGTFDFTFDFHDDDHDWLSVRPIAADGTKGDWTVCGNTLTGGEDLPPNPATGTCLVVDGKAELDGAIHARIEARGDDGIYAVVETRNIIARPVVDPAAFGVELDDLRIFSFEYGLPDRTSDQPFDCAPVDDGAFDYPELECREPSFYRGSDGVRPIIGTKGRIGDITDDRLTIRETRWRLTDANGKYLAEAGTRRANGAWDTATKVKDLEPGEYGLSFRVVFRPVPGVDERPRTAWLACGTVTVER